MAVKRARGKRSRAISDQSGFEIPYTSLKTTWEGYRVEPEEWDPKNPQLTPAKNVIDATALFKPRPDNDPDNVSFFVGFNYDIFLDRNQRPNVGIIGFGKVGDVLIEFTEDISSGVGGTGAVGTEVTELSIDEAGVAGTGAVGTESVEVLGWGQEGWGVAEWGD